MFIDRFIRIGHGNYVNAVLDGGKIFAYFNTGDSVVKKEIIIGKKQVKAITISSKPLAMTEVLPLNSSLSVARYEKSVRLF